jgi:hypothetical protein
MRTSCYLIFSRPALDEETNITAISEETKYLKTKSFEGQFCYTQNKDNSLKLMNCSSRLNFICLRPLTVNEEYFPKNTTLLGIDICQIY